MGKKKNKRIIRRESRNVVLLRRTGFPCRECYPVNEYSEVGAKRMPLVTTIYVGKLRKKVQNRTVNIRIAWCASCLRWKAEEIKGWMAREDVDLATELSDGQQGKGEMTWEMFKRYI